MKSDNESTVPSISFDSSIVFASDGVLVGVVMMMMMMIELCRTLNQQSERLISTIRTMIGRKKSDFLKTIRYALDDFVIDGNGFLISSAMHSS